MVDIHFKIKFQVIHKIANKIDTKMISGRNESYALENYLTLMGSCSVFNSKIGSHFKAK